MNDSKNASKMNVNNEFYRQGFEDGIKVATELFNKVIATELSKLLEVYDKTIKK